MEEQKELTVADIDEDAEVIDADELTVEALEAESAPRGDTADTGAVNDEAAVQKTPAQRADEKRQDDIREFVAEYGTALDPQSIPPEVWTSVAKGKTLLSAYQSWENKQLKEENDMLRKNKENKARSTGSRETAGSGKPRGVIEDDWYNKE